MYITTIPIRKTTKTRNKIKRGKTMFKTLIKETSLLIGNKKRITYKRKKATFEKVFPVALGIGIALINIPALYPHIFPLTSQLAITIGLALAHWL